MSVVVKRYKDKIRYWIWKAVHHKSSELILGVVSFIESSFFLIPPDVFLIPMVALRRDRWRRYVLITTVTSVLGAGFGYLIGFYFYEIIGEYLIDIYHLHSAVAEVGILYNKNVFLAVFLSAFTPLPFKVFTLIGGFLAVPIIPFIAASILGRGLRFFLEGWLMYKFGEKIVKAVFKYMDTLTIFLVAAIVVIIFLI